MDPQKFNAMIEAGRALAIQHRHLYYTTEHFLAALLPQPEVTKALRDLDCEVDEINEELEHYFQNDLESETNPDVPDDELAEMTDSLNAVIFETMEHAESAGVAFPRAIDFLITLLDQKESFGAMLFDTQNINALALKKWAARHPNQTKPKDQVPAQQKTPIGSFISGLEKILGPFKIEHIEQIEDCSDELEHNDEEEPNLSDVDWNDPQTVKEEIKKLHGSLVLLNDEAEAGRLDPIIGRDQEIQACIQTLLRRNKPNVLITGESGIGKTAIVHGLVQRIVEGRVPAPLRKCVVLSLDVTSLKAGTQFRGELEKRLKKIIDIVRSIPNAILFVDEIQNTARDMGAHGDPSILSYFKPYLTDKTIRMIGTTTQEDGRNGLLDDKSIMRRFYKLVVNEPSMALTRDILNTLRCHYERFHNVIYSDEALDATVSLCQRYIQDRRFPDKAIDVIDEAGARNRALPIGDQKQTIEPEDIEGIIAKIANIPELKASVDERAQLKDAATRLKAVVFGQDKAIDTVLRLIKLSRAGLRPNDKPVASLLFAGPTGVGKTEIARQLAQILNLSFIRFDMSEYQEEYSISKLIGSAPGYVGSEKGGLLTEAIRSKPHCVLLLDEIEKAHPKIYDVFLQVMDAARLTDNAGNTVDFRNVIFIMTSNAGGRELGQHTIGFSESVDLSKSEKAIERAFSPEFRNRLDEVIIFNALDKSVMARIVDKFVHELETRLIDKDIQLKLTDDARVWLAERGFNDLLGARPLARLIQEQISYPLADEVLFNGLEQGGTVTIRVNAQNDGLVLESKPA